MTGALAVIVMGALAGPRAATAAADKGAPPAPVAVPGMPPTQPAPALPPPVVDTVSPAAAAGGAAAGPAAAPTAVPRRVAPVPTADAVAAPSDHDAVVGHVGIQARRLQPVPFPLALRAVGGCPVAQTTPCTVEMGALEARYWQSRNLAWSAGLALAVGGGRDQGQALDSYVGVGPIVGLTLLLGNWRHLAIGASPEVGFVWFRPGGGSAQSTKLVDLRAALEAELHFGFVGVPALSVGIMAGLGFRYESAGDARVWSIGVIGADSVWGTLSNLFVRYYL